MDTLPRHPKSLNLSPSRSLQPYGEEDTARLLVMYPDPHICPFLMQWCHEFDLPGFTFEVLSDHGLPDSSADFVRSRAPHDFDGVVLGLTGFPVDEQPWQLWLRKWARDRSRSGKGGALICLVDRSSPDAANLPFFHVWKMFLKPLTVWSGIRLRFCPLFPPSFGGSSGTLADYQFLFEPGKATPFPEVPGG